MHWFSTETNIDHMNFIQLPFHRALVKKVKFKALRNSWGNCSTPSNKYPSIFAHLKWRFAKQMLQHDITKTDLNLKRKKPNHWMLRCFREDAIITTTRAFCSVTIQCCPKTAALRAEDTKSTSNKCDPKSRRNTDSITPNLQSYRLCPVMSQLSLLSSQTNITRLTSNRLRGHQHR